MKKTILLCGIVLALIGVLTLGLGIKTTEKTTFKDVDSNGKMFIRFINVYLERLIFGAFTENVRLYPKDKNWIEIKIEHNLAGTLISVYPTFWEKFGQIRRFVKAKKVIIHVPNKKDKEIWKKWAEKAYKELCENKKNKNKKPPLKRIVPNI